MACFDLASQNISLLLHDVHNLSMTIRKDMIAANEKDRSIGFLSEQLAECCYRASEHQKTTVQSALVGFATILCRVELARKALYQRMAPLSSAFLATSAGTVQQVYQIVRKRDAAMKKAQRLPAPQYDPQPIKSNALRTQATELNTQSVQEIKTWHNVYNNDIKETLREYAHAQMEFAALALEQWSSFLEDLTVLDFNRDTEDIMNMLEFNPQDAQA